MECTCCPLFLKPLQTLALQAAPITERFQLITCNQAELAHNEALHSSTDGGGTGEPDLSKALLKHHLKKINVSTIETRDAEQSAPAGMSGSTGSIPPYTQCMDSTLLGRDKAQREGNTKMLSPQPSPFGLTHITLPEMTTARKDEGIPEEEGKCSLKAIKKGKSLHLVSNAHKRI